MVQEMTDGVNGVNGLLTAVLSLGTTVGVIAQAMAKLPRPTAAGWWQAVYPWLNPIVGNWGNAKNRGDGNGL